VARIGDGAVARLLAIGVWHGFSGCMRCGLLGRPMLTQYGISVHIPGQKQQPAGPHGEESAMSHGQFSIEEAGSGAIPRSRLAAAAVFIAMLFTVPPVAAQKLSVWTNLTTAAQATGIQKQVTPCDAQPPGGA